MRKLVFFLFLCLPVSLNAQSVINGQVSDAETKEALVKAIVKVLNDNKQLIAYAITDKSGNYSVKIKTSLPEVFLSVHYLGYRTEEVKISNRTFRKNFILYPEAVVLKEVHVKPRVIEKNGDTLSYNVTSFKMEQDRSIADVLKKMPGISVSSNGSVKYQGKPINKFYIEGLDLLGRKYGVATTSVPADAVSTVQVLEGHQPIKALGKYNTTGQAALNLVLKEKKRIRPIGYLEGGLGGMKDQLLWKADLFGLSVAPKKQALFSYKGNNVGKSLAELEAGEIVSMDDVASGLSATPSNLFSGVVLRMLPVESNRYVSNTSHLFNYNQLWGQESVQWRMFGSYLNERNKQEIHTSKGFFLPGDEHYLSVEDNASGIRENKLTLMLEAESNKEKSYWDNKLETYADWQYHDYQLVTNEVSRNQRLRMPTLAVQNNLKVIKKVGQNTLNFHSYVRYLNQPQKMKVKSTGVENTGLITQKAGRGVLYTQHGGDYSYSHRNSSFTLGAQLKAIVDDYETENDNEVLSGMGHKMKNDLRNNNYVFSLLPQYSYNDKIRKMFVRLGLPVSFHFYDVDYKDREDKRIEVWNLEPDVLFRYDLTDDWKASLNYSHKRQLGDVLDFADMPVMQNYQYVGRGSGILERRNSETYTFRLTYRNDIEALFFNFSAIYRKMDVNVVSGTSFANDCILNYTDELSDERNLKIINVSLSKFVDALRTSVSMSGAYSGSTLSRYQQGHLFPWNTDSYQSSVNFNSKVASWMNINGKWSYLTTWYDNGGTDKLRSQLCLGLMEAYFIPTSQWLLSLSGEYVWNKSGGMDADRYLFMDAKVGYKAKRWELEVVWQNLLNKGVYENVSFSDLSSTSISFPLRRSNIVTSLRCNF